MRYLSLFSGIEAATSAWHPLGWECAGVAEIESFPSKVLRHHYPNVRNLGDVTKLTEMDIADLGPIDVVVFGSPCQDLSVAGKRKGLAGARSGLFFTAMQIITWSRLWCGTRFALWENVPGAFSSNKGADFAAVVDELSGLAGTEPPPKGWGTEGCAAGPEAMVEWSTLDAQWFGVAQRRRRVFALADFGNWAGRQPILLEPQGVRGDTAPRREARQGAPAGTLRCTDGGRFVDVNPTLDTRAKDGPIRNLLAGCVAHTLRGTGFDASEDGTGRGTPLVPVLPDDWSPEQRLADINLIRAARGDEPLAFDTTQITSKANRSNPQPGDPCHPLAAGAHPPAIAFDSRQDCVSSTAVFGAIGSSSPQAQAVAFQERGRADGRLLEIGGEVAYALTAPSGGGRSQERNVLTPTMQVRRLTPRECERLQGFPDDHTLLPGLKKPVDGPRYKALGNSMAVPVMRWIGRRIDLALLFQE